MIQVRQLAAQRLLQISIGLTLLGFLSFWCCLLKAQADVAQEFRASNAGGGHEYSEIRTVQLKKLTFVLALWHPNNSALDLSADIYRYVPGSRQPTFAKEYSGDLSEEILHIAPMEIAGSDHLQLGVLCRSGQIKILRILEEKQQALTLVFENGGTDVTVVKQAKEIWLKSDSARQVDVYRWNREQSRYTKTRTLDIL